MRRLGDDAGRAAGDLASVGKGEGDTAGPGCGNLSFAPETLVTLADGSRQPIARVRVGDQVRAFDPTTGQASAQTVQATWIQHDTNLFAVTLRMTRDTDTDTAVSGVRKARRVAVVSHGSQAPPLSSAGATTSSASTTTRSAPTITGDETIATTANHPWLTVDRGWAQAGSLTLGERMVRADGSTAVVVAVRAVAGTAPMYDLTVANLHDFAVGSGAYVVHNCGGGGEGESQREPPTLEIDADRMPNIARNIQAAQDEGSPSVLTRETDGVRVRANRAAACAGFCGEGSPDEYPFASTQEGGVGARVAGVPLAEQHIQGGILSAFYRENTIGQGDLFRVVVRGLN